jgi:hypothetical protein
MRLGTTHERAFVDVRNALEPTRARTKGMVATERRGTEQASRRGVRADPSPLRGPRLRALEEIFGVWAGDHPMLILVTAL